jgi:hypothetical protein
MLRTLYTLHIFGSFGKSQSQSGSSDEDTPSLLRKRQDFCLPFRSVSFHWRSNSGLECFLWHKSCWTLPCLQPYWTCLSSCLLLIELVCHQACYLLNLSVIMLAAYWTCLSSCLLLIELVCHHACCLLNLPVIMLSTYWICLSSCLLLIELVCHHAFYLLNLSVNMLAAYWTCLSSSLLLIELVCHHACCLLNLPVIMLAAAECVAAHLLPPTLRYRYVLSHYASNSFHEG